MGLCAKDGKNPAECGPSGPISNRVDWSDEKRNRWDRHPMAGQDARPERQNAKERGAVRNPPWSKIVEKRQEVSSQGKPE